MVLWGLGQQGPNEERACLGCVTASTEAGPYGDALSRGFSQLFPFLPQASELLEALVGPCTPNTSQPAAEGLPETSLTSPKPPALAVADSSQQ